MVFFKFVDWLFEKIVAPIVVIIGLFVALAFVVGIIARSFLGISLFGVEELILMAVVWFYMLGAILASKDSAHLRADFVSVMVNSERVEVMFQILATLISIAMAGLFMSWSYDLFQWALRRGSSTPIFSIPVYISQVSLFVAATFMMLYLIRDLVRDIQTLVSTKKNNRTPVSR